jgi:hypothetical protein
MVSEGKLTERTQGTLEEIRARLTSIENRLDHRDEVRFCVHLGAMVAVMITMWITTLLVIFLL